MKIARVFLVMLIFVFASHVAQAFNPDTNSKLELDVQRAIIKIRKEDSGIEVFFANSAGYAIFPSIGKGGLFVGGAFGKGLVIVNEEVDGYTSTTLVSVGAQIGGQKYSLYIFFKDQVALDNFKRGNFEFSAQASAVAVTQGAAVKTAYDGGVAVFTIADGGLMAEASIAGQRFTYEPKHKK